MTVKFFAILLNTEKSHSDGYSNIWIQFLLDLQFCNTNVILYEII